MSVGLGALHFRYCPRFTVKGFPLAAAGCYEQIASQRMLFFTAKLFDINVSVYELRLAFAFGN